MKNAPDLQFEDAPDLQFEKQAVVSPQQKAPLLQRISESAPIETVLGAGDAVRQMLGNILPQAIRPKYQPTGDPTRLSYKIGSGAGDIGAFAASIPLGGEALGAAKALPAIGRGAEWLAQTRLAPTLARRIGGTALYGALTDPDRTRGLASGGAGGAIAEMIPGIGALGRKLSPQKLTENIMKTMSQGRGLEENSKSLAKDIRNSYKENQAEAKQKYGDFFQKAGGNEVFPSNYLNMEDFDDTVKSYLPDTKTLHNKFMKNPTVENAHSLQSQLGSDLSSLYKAPIGTAEHIKSQYYNRAINSLKNDMNENLLNQDATGELSKNYQDAADFYKNKIVPYKRTGTLYKISTGKLKNPKNISAIFKNPEENIENIVNDLEPSAKNKILYSEIGKRINLTPEKLDDEVKKLDKKGLSTYITPELERNLDKLGIRTKLRESLQRLGGFGVGMAIPGLLGARGGLTEQILSGLGGAALSPTAGKIAAKLFPRRIGVYPALRTAALGTLLGGQK